MPLHKRRNTELESADSLGESREDQPMHAARLGYKKLEQRQVLSASFVAGVGGIFLDSFDPGEDLFVGQAQTAVNGVSQDTYLFILDSGSWTGSSADPLVEVESVNGGTNNRLEVATSLFGGATNGLISIDGSTSANDIELDQVTASLTFDSLTISNITNVNRSLNLDTTGDLFASDIHVVDSNPNDAFKPNAQLEIETTGSITANGPITNQIDNIFDDITLTAKGVNSDISIAGRVEAAMGNIFLNSADTTSILSTGHVLSVGSGDIHIITGTDPLSGDSGDLLSMDDGSTIVADTGSVLLTSENDALLSSVTSNANNDAVIVNSGGSILDNTSNENENVTTVNGRILLTANQDVGTSGSGDIDINSIFLQFNSNGQTFVSDLRSGLNIDRLSTADLGAQIHSDNFLTISNDVRVGDDSKFSSGSGNHDLTIENNAVLTLNAAANRQLELESGDDILFDNGRAITVGASHTVILTADLQGAVDSDRGEISNTAGNTDSIVTHNLVANANNGIGDSASLRIDVDHLTAINSGENNISIDETNSIELVDLQTNNGAIVVRAGGNIEATKVVSGESESAEDNSDDVVLISTAGDITLANVESADNLNVDSPQGRITDQLSSRIVVSADALFRARDLISLADNSNDLLDVSGNATFTSDVVQIGRDFQAAGAANSFNTVLGSVTLNAETAILVEDDGTLFRGNSDVDRLYVASATQIGNQSGASLRATTHAQFNAPDEVVLGNQPNDSIELSEVGLFTSNAHVEVDVDTIINGRAPDPTPNMFGTAAAKGTNISSTLHLASSGSVIQQAGLLNVNELAIEAGDHVHLASVSPANQAIAISAGNAGALTDSNQISELSALSGVGNSEVDASRAQSIAIKHQGQLNVASVDSHLGAPTITGFATTNGSIFASAEGTIDLQDNVSANSTTRDPQVTIYSALGTSTDPGIEFNGGIISVSGASNVGVVNANQTTATFFDADGNVLNGTTELLLLNTDGSADQDIVVEYGHTGESGYRVGIVWDKDNQPGSPVETINTYVADPQVATEAYEDSIYQSNPNTFLQIGGNEGARETFAKVSRYSKDAIVAHQDQPKVFSEVTVRNDQDINLFTGSLSSTTNSLNEIRETLIAELDAPKKFVPNLPVISKINPIEVKTDVFVPLGSSSPEASSGVTFARDVQPFETGDLKWIQVQVPISELEEIEGDVRLKDPTKIFQNADNAEANDLADEIGDNEVEKIIEVIETDDKAEAGYWYKVFKDYRNRDDELFFYHFKTGEPQQSDDGAPTDIQSATELDVSPERKAIGAGEFESPTIRFESDFNEPENSPTPEPDGSEKALDGESERAIPLDSFERPIELEPANTGAISPTSANSAAIRSLSVGSLLGAAVLLSNDKISKQNKIHEDASPENSHQTDFSRLARLKRKIKKLLD